MAVVEQLHPLPQWGYQWRGKGKECKDLRFWALTNCAHFAQQAPPAPPLLECCSLFYKLKGKGGEENGKENMSENGSERRRTFQSSFLSCSSLRQRRLTPSKDQFKSCWRICMMCLRSALCAAVPGSAPFLFSDTCVMGG